MKTETNNEVGHTPGPWKFGGRHSWEVYHAASGVAICSMQVKESPWRDLPIDEANARLIAAAPELRRETESAGNKLKEVSNWLKAFRNAHPEFGEAIKSTFTQWAAECDTRSASARAALAKVEGTP